MFRDNQSIGEGKGKDPINYSEDKSLDDRVDESFQLDNTSSLETNFLKPEKKSWSQKRREKAQEKKEKTLQIYKSLREEGYSKVLAKYVAKSTPKTDKLKIAAAFSLGLGVGRMQKSVIQSISKASHIEEDKIIRSSFWAEHISNAVAIYQVNAVVNLANYAYSHITGHTFNTEWKDLVSFGYAMLRQYFTLKDGIKYYLTGKYRPAHMMAITPSSAWAYWLGFIHEMKTKYNHKLKIDTGKAGLGLAGLMFATTIGFGIKEITSQNYKQIETKEEENQITYVVQYKDWEKIYLVDNKDDGLIFGKGAHKDHNGFDKVYAYKGDFKTGKISSVNIQDISDKIKNAEKLVIDNQSRDKNYLQSFNN